MAGITLATAVALYLAAIDGVGFPDGHLTEYERWVLPFRKAAVGALGALAVGFLGLAASKTDTHTGSRLFRAALVAAVVLTLGALLLLPAIGLHALQLEHGQGG